MLKGHDVLMLSPADAFKQPEGVHRLPAPEKPIPYQTAHEPDLGGMQQSAVFCLEPCADADINAGGKGACIAGDLRIQRMDPFQDHQFIGSALNGLAWFPALLCKIEYRQLDGLTPGEPFQMFIQQGDIQPVGGFVVDDSVLVQCLRSLGFRQVVIVHGQYHSSASPALQ